MAHKLLKKKQKKNKKKIIQYKSLIKPPQSKIFTSSSQGQVYQALSLPNPRPLYFGLKPINCLPRDSFGCKSIPSCNCPGKERKFQPSIRTVIRKGVGTDTPVTSTSLRQILILVISDKIIVYFTGQRYLLPPLPEFWPLELVYGPSHLFHFF